MMKVLIVNDHLHDVGGAESYTLNLCKELMGRGVEVVAVCSKDGRDHEDVAFRYYHVKAHPIDYRHGFSKLWNPESEKEVKRIVELEKPDVVHFQSVFSRLSTAALRGATGIVPTVMTVHDYRFDCSESKLDRNLNPCPHDTVYGLNCLKNGCTTPWMFGYQLMRNMAARNNMKELDSIIAPSTFMKKALEQVLGRNVLYIPHGINLKEYDYKPTPGKKRILFIGRLVVDKGLDYLIKAMKEVVAEHPDSELIVVGDGPEDESLRREAEGVDQIRFLGKVPNSRVRELYSDSDIVCMPSIWQDNSPMVTYEAMASGRPIIASRVGGIPDMVLDGVNGFLVPPKDVTALKEKIIELLSNPGKTSRMGRASRQRAEKEYSIQKHLENIVSVYDETIEKFRKEG